MATIFSKIISGEIPAHIVAENESFIAFLDISPLVIGHVLVVPKIEVDYIFDMDDSLLGELMIYSKFVAKKIKAVISCARIGVSVIGLEVPHTHVHLVPMNAVSDMNFAKSKLQPDSGELAKIAMAIREA